VGGISPVDEVNPDYDHPDATDLRQRLAIAGWHLIPRLPVYPQYDSWLPGELKRRVAAWRNKLQHDSANPDRSP
jgi:FO synthase subunit 1